MKHWLLSKAPKPGDILSNLQKETKSKIPKMPSIPKNMDLKLPANINVKSISDFLQQMAKNVSQPPPSGPPRPMKFPYTFSAKIAQFPYKFYFKNNWIARWYPIGIIACVPLFWFIGKKANSKENKAKWKEIRRLEKEEAHHKFE